MVAKLARYFMPTYHKGIHQVTEGVSHDVVEWRSAMPDALPETKKTPKGLLLNTFLSKLFP